MAMACWLTLLECHRIQLCFQYQNLDLWLSHQSTSMLSLTPLMSQSNRNDRVLVVYPHHHGTMVHVSLYAGLPTSSLPAAHSMHACLPLPPEVSTHFHRIKTMLSCPILSNKTTGRWSNTMVKSKKVDHMLHEQQQNMQWKIIHRYVSNWSLGNLHGYE